MILRPSTALRQKQASFQTEATLALVALGWTRAGEKWVNPRTGKARDLATAILCEQLRGQIRAHGKKRAV